MSQPDIPSIGFGTADLEDEKCIQAVTQALEAGFRHIDTAQWYRNERQVGKAIAQSRVDRSDIFVATKLGPKDLGYHDVLEKVDENLERLGLESVELLYIHWPSHAYEPEQTLPAFDELREMGKIDRIGVCNFLIDQLEEARSILESSLSVHQFEHHPLFQNTEHVEYCLENEITPVGFSPLARGQALENRVIKEIASTRKITPAQVCLLWAHERNVIPIPKARGDHVRENRQALQEDLTDQDVERIDSINLSERLADPDWAPWNSSD
jgi:2,5-diketo-D-gluconate reductase B